MNHTSVISNLAAHIQRAKNLAYLGYPYTLGETNSIAGQGRNGETNVFGDALWLVDFSLWAAEHNIRRLHFHQGTDYRYGSWQPISHKGLPVATRPPYYGQVMVAKALGRSEQMRIKNLALEGDTEAAYALFDGERLARVVVLNMQTFNSSTAGERPSKNYRFRVPSATAATGSRVKVERLMAAGSDAEDGTTFGGVSYDYNLQQGKPVVVDDKKEAVDVEDGVVAVDVPDSSAALLSF